MTTINRRRRFHEVVDTLPDERNKVYSRHHLFWTAADINEVGLADFRGIGCTSARNMDSMVHSLTHMRFGGVLSVRHPGVRRDLRRRANQCLLRHEGLHCGCYDTRRLVIIDPLTLEVQPVRGFDLAPCTAIAVDQDVYRLMRDYYAVAAPVTDRIRDALDERHDQHDCGCYRHIGSGRVFRPELYRLLPQLQRRSVA